MLNYSLVQILKNCVQTHSCSRKRTEVVLVRLNFNRIGSPLVFTTYNLHFLLFLGNFRTCLGLVIFSPGRFLGKSTWLFTLRWCLVPFVLPRKASEQPFVHFSWNPKWPWKERKGIHIFVKIHMIPFQWPPMSLGGIPWHSELGSRKSLKRVFFSFGDIFGLLRAWSYFLPKQYYECQRDL